MENDGAGGPSGPTAPVDPSSPHPLGVRAVVVGWHRPSAAGFTGEGAARDRAEPRMQQCLGQTTTAN